MKLARRRVEEPQLNLTSLIDVVFLLLIFFMVTTTFVRNPGLQITLPQAGEHQPVSADEEVEVVVDARNRVYIGGKIVAVDAKALRAALQRRAGGNFQQPLLVRADGRASHQSVVGVMDAAAALGFSRVDIATQPVTEP